MELIIIRHLWRSAKETSHEIHLLLIRKFKKGDGGVLRIEPICQVFKFYLYYNYSRIGNFFSKLVSCIGSSVIINGLKPATIIALINKKRVIEIRLVVLKITAFKQGNFSAV